MIYDRTTVVVRSRGALELYDLALLVCRRFGWRLALLAAIGVGPWLILDAWLLAAASQGDGWERWYPLLMLIAVQGPLATAPVTAFLGEAMFSEAPSARRALRTAAASWWLLLVMGLWRGCLAIIAPLLLLYPAHVVEVAVLERQPFRATLRRAHALRHAWSGDWILHLCLAIPVTIAGLAIILSGFEMAGGLLFHADPWLEDSWSVFNPGVSLAPHLGMWAMVSYLAVVRFLAYLDLRTRHEGWELDLQLKRAAQQVEAG